MSKDKPDASHQQPSRRTVIKGAAGALATIAALRAAFPGGVPSAYAAGAPETTKARLGYIALVDSAPLIIAKEKGIFAKYGVPDVEVTKQASWGATRDNIVLGGASGGIDGAHILSPIPYLMTTGTITQSNVSVPMVILARLNLDAQAISVSNAYKDQKAGVDATPLKEAFAAKKAAGSIAKVAVTFPGGNHDLWVRYWLAAAGIDPDKDVETLTVPPPQMVANMKVGTMDVFCVGEPWNGQLVNQRIGYTACATSEMWAKHPEKAFSMRADFVEKHPNATLAILAAIQEAQMWCDKMENRDELATIVGTRQWFNVPVADIVGRLKGEYDYGNGRVESGKGQHMKFWEGHASYPYASHDTWFVTEDIRWGKLPPTTDIKALVGKVNRGDMWLEAAKLAGVTDLPAGPSRGPETFFDGKVFDPADPMAYLKSLSIKRAEV